MCLFWDNEDLTFNFFTCVVTRRFIWNFFRLENEHLNNCGQFRVVRDISIHPLNLSEVPPQDEEGAEFRLRNHLREERRMSGLLAEVSG